MDAMFATSSQANEVDSWAFSAPAASSIKKKKKVKKLAEEPPPPPEPELEPEPVPEPATLIDDPYSGWGASTLTSKKKKKTKFVEQPSLPEPEAAHEPELVQELEHELAPAPESESVPATEPVEEEDTWGAFAAFAPSKKAKKKKKGWSFEEPPSEDPTAVPTEQPTQEPTQEPTEEPMAVGMPEMVPITAEPVSTLDSTIRTPTRSPYTEPPVALRIGPNETVHYVPHHLLLSAWTSAEPGGNLDLPDIDLETGHTLVHFFYTGTYQALTNSNSAIGLKRALLVLIALQSWYLPDLQHLTKQEIEKHAATLEIFEILDAVKDNFARLDSQGWVYGFLREKAQAAFEKDHTIFKNEALLATLDNAVLGKLVMQWVVEMYDEKFKRMLAVERAAEADAKDWMDKYNSVLQKLHNAGCGDMVQQDVIEEQELIPPVVDECCAQEVSEHGSVETDGFCTISCPSEEGAEQDDGVVVDEGDLSGPVELLNNEVGETEVYAEEAVCEDTVGYAEEAVCEETTHEPTFAAEPEPVPAEEEAAATAAAAEPAVVERETAVDPFAGLNKLQRMKLQKRMRIEARRKKEEEATRIEEENAAEVERIRLEEARLREEEEAAAIAMTRAHIEEARLRDEAETSAADAVVLEPEPVIDTEPKVCPLRARHMIKEKRWMKCSSCRAAMQHMAVRLSRTNVDEETLQDLEKELII